MIVALRIVTMAARPPVRLRITFSLWTCSLSMLRIGSLNSVPNALRWLTSAITLATCSEALSGAYIGIQFFRLTHQIDFTILQEHP